MHYLAIVNTTTLQHYHALHDHLSDMIEDGRLRKADFPDDYDFLVESLAQLSGEGSECNPCVLILCKGGLVQNVVSDVPLKVSILDYDDPTDGDTIIDVSQTDGTIESAALSNPQCEFAPDRVNKVVEFFRNSERTRTGRARLAAT